MNIVITAESTIDIPEDMLKKFNIKTVPFGISFDNRIENDRFGISRMIFDYVEKSKKLPKTSAVSPEQYKDFFTNLKKEYDAIIHISLSSLISSAYSNAVSVAEKMDNVYIVDSRNLSTGIAILAMYASNLVKKSKTKNALEIYNKVLEKVPKVRTSFVLDRLNYLYKGGRCSALSLFGANILKIKPQIIVDNGKMIVGKKYLGNLKSAIDRYCSDMLNSCKNIDLDCAFITHSSDMPEIQDMVKAKLSTFGFKHIYDTLAGGTICSHCGPNCLGILFMVE